MADAPQPPDENQRPTPTPADHTPVTRRGGDEADDAPADEGPQPVEIARTSRAHAETARARLERTGIACAIRRVDGAPDEAAIWVEGDLEDLAREALAEVEIDAEDPDAFDDEEPADAESRLLANWVCPRCHEPGLVLVPLPRRWMHLRILSGALLLLPFVLLILGSGIPELSRMTAQSVICTTLSVGALGLAASLVLPHREKQCKACGWQSAGPRES
jgi:hypothetical protein